jgi:hypothetical protein
LIYSSKLLNCRRMKLKSQIRMIVMGFIKIKNAQKFFVVYENVRSDAIYRVADKPYIKI